MRSSTQRKYNSTFWPMSYLQLIINWLFYVESSLDEPKRELIEELGTRANAVVRPSTSYVSVKLFVLSLNIIIQSLMNAYMLVLVMVKTVYSITQLYTMYYYV